MKIARRHIIILTLMGAVLVVLGWEIYTFVINYPAAAQPTTRHTILKRQPTPARESYCANYTSHESQPPKSHVENDWPALIIKQKEYIDLTNKIEITNMQLRLIYEKLAIVKARYQIVLLEARTKNLMRQQAEIDSNNSNTNKSHYHLLHTMPLLRGKKNSANIVFNKPDTSITTSTLSINAEDTINLDIYTLDEISILELPADNYTIMLLGSFNKSDLASYAQKNNLGTRAIYYSIKKQKRPWFILLYSHYNTKAEAEAALQQFAPELKQSRPKVKRIDKIQQALKNKSKNLGSTINE